MRTIDKINQMLDEKDISGSTLNSKEENYHFTNKNPRPARAEAGKTGKCQINCKRDHLARLENARMVCNGFD